MNIARTLSYTKSSVVCQKNDCFAVAANEIQTHVRAKQKPTTGFKVTTGV